jgi:CHAD domain-containing protein
MENDKTNPTNPQGPEDSQEPKTTYTLEEVQELLQKEGDRRVSQALKKAREEAKKQVAEAQKLAVMDEQQRYQYELENAKAELEQLKREKAIAENTQATLRVLAKRNLPAELLDYVITEDADSTLEKIDSLQKILTKWVNAEVDKRIPKQGTPKAGTTPSQEPTSLAGMKVAEIQHLKQTDPELFNKLVGKN